MGSTLNRGFHRELKPGDDGLDPSGEIAYGLEYRVDFEGGVARRYQAVITTTDLHSSPLDQDKAKARRFIEATIGEFLEERLGAETPEELDDALALGRFTLVRDEPQNKYKLWQRVVRMPREEPR